MDGGFQRLQFAHALVNGNALFLQVIIAVCAAFDLFKADRHGGSSFKGCEKVLVLLHVARQFVHTDIGKLFAFGL